MSGMATCAHVSTRRHQGCFQMFLVTIETGSILSPLYLTYFHLNELPISCSCCPIIYSSLSHSHISRPDCQVRAFSAAPHLQLRHGPSVAPRVLERFQSLLHSQSTCPMFRTTQWRPHSTLDVSTKRAVYPKLFSFCISVDTAF